MAAVRKMEGIMTIISRKISE